MLISCVAYQNGRKLADIPTEDISEYVSRPDCFVWVALFEPSPEELDEMAEEFGLHELAVDDARHGHQRPKIEEYGDSLFAVLHTVEHAKTPDGDEELLTGEVDVFVGRNYVLSVRQRTQVGFRGRARARRTRARTAAARLGLRVLRADGQRRRPLFPHPRRAGDRARGDRGADLRAQHRALEHRGAVRVEAEADGAEARGGSADGGHRPAVRRPRAADLRGHGRLFPRRLRPPASHPPGDRGHPRHADHGDTGQPRHDLAVRDPR